MSVSREAAVFEFPVESRNKYGKGFDDADGDDFALELSGGKPSIRRSVLPQREDAPGGNSEVDENFLRGLIANSEGKYGR